MTPPPGKPKWGEDTKALALLIAEEALETKAQDLKILDLRKLVSFTDYFILCSGTSQRHVQGIADRVSQRLKKDYRRLPLNQEGYAEGQWVLLDFADVVLHVFQMEAREFYDLDSLWADAPRLRPTGEKKKARKKSPKSGGKTRRVSPKKKTL